MVVIRGSPDYVKKLMGKEAFNKIESFSRIIGFEAEIANEVKIEFNPDRPDLFSFVTLNKAIHEYYFSEGRRDYKSDGIGIKVSNENLDTKRPVILTYAAKGGKIGEHLKDLIDFHEAISDNVGRSRVKAAIGLHNMDMIKPPLIYGKVDGRTFFCPYDHASDQPLARIMKEHDKGIQYSHLSMEGERVFALMDKDGIISIPPTLNGRRTKIDEETSNFFIDITATDLHTARKLKLLSIYYFNSLGYSIFDDSGTLNSGTLRNGFESYKIKDWKKISKYVGNDLESGEIWDYLRKMGYEGDGDNILIPFYRIDVMGFVDIVEDVCKARGYDNIIEKEISIDSFGKPDVKKSKAEFLAEIMIGLGFQQVMSFFITNPKNNNGVEITNAFGIMNPKSQDFSTLRNAIFPELLKFFQRNVRRSYPQKIFEIGRVIQSGRESDHISFAIIDSKNGYSAIKGYLEAFLEAIIGKDHTIMSDNEDNSFINGRGGQILIKGNSIGSIGEIHPEVLFRYGLSNPVTVVEINLDSLYLNL
ncbi:MAG: phenylalanine--tRNA ligase subunit beta [Thermoplasmataceae archaeon]